MGFLQRSQRSLRPHLEILEDRTLMSTCQVTSLGDAGRRSDLRYCINKVNAEPGPDIIIFSRTGEINLTAALPDLASDIQIRGPGANLLTVRRDTGGDYRIFRINAGANVSISGLTIANGMVATGPSSFGGGIYNAGNLILSSSTVIGNRVESKAHYANGGGIYNHHNSNLTIIDSVISNNRAAGWETSVGGGICNSGTASIYSSAIVGNVAENAEGLLLAGLGAGISNICLPPVFVGNLLLINSTVHSNDAMPNGNGGIGGIVGQGFVVISHTTIASNRGEGFFCSSSAQCFIRNTVVANNSGGDLSGNFASSGYNLIGDSSEGSGFAPTDILDVDPLLGPLQDNGGRTPTAALLPDSPAIDAGDNADAPEWDQRGPGFPRIVNGTIDIGAYELQSAKATNPPHFLAFLITAYYDQAEQETIP